MKRGWILALFALGAGLFHWKMGCPKYEVSVVAIFRDESRFLKEWIEYHRMVGVDHFYLLNNLSRDGHEEVLEPYVKAGIVELFNWPFESGCQKEWNRVQCGAYCDLVAKKKRESRWMAMIDTDEFIVPMEGDSVKKFLKGFRHVGGVGINWQLFGTSEVERIPEGKTLIGTLLKRAPQDHERNAFVKTIFQPKRVKKIKQPHVCKYLSRFYHVDEKGEGFPKRSMTEAVSVDRIRINHYTYRDGAFFEEEKRRRILEWFPGADPRVDPELSSVEDQAILRFVPELERRLFSSGEESR